MPRSNSQVAHEGSKLKSSPTQSAERELKASPSNLSGSVSQPSKGIQGLQGPKSTVSSQDGAISIQTRFNVISHSTLHAY